MVITGKKIKIFQRGGDLSDHLNAAHVDPCQHGDQRH